MAAKKKTTKKKQASEQPGVNIGMVGHVDHGKTTLLERLSGKWTDTHSEELKRGITIRLGYANVVIRKTKDGEFTTEGEGDPVRTVSFVDAPGHESLMAVMLSGATSMDGALLLVAANEQCPQPQTIEHLMALEIIGIKNVIVVQNKIDLVDEEQALKNYEQIKKLLEKTSFKDAPIIPISAQHKVGMNRLLAAVEEIVPTPKRDAKDDPQMFVARSFDINKPGTDVNKLTGGVLGGSLKQGQLNVGDDIEIRPGYQVKEKNQIVWKPIRTKVTSLQSGADAMDSIGPGGSVAVMTSLDPSVVKSDQLSGAIAGLPEKMPPVWHELIMKVNLLDRVVGSEKKEGVDPIKMGEPLMLNVNSAATVGQVSEMKKGKTKVALRLPVCAPTGSRVTISRRIGNRFRLIGFGELVEK